MAPTMRPQSTHLLRFVFALAALFPGTRVAAQTLSFERVGEGVELYVVTLPLSDAVTACWPQPKPDGTLEVVCRSGGGLTAVADIEAGLRAGSEIAELPPAPSLVAVVGGGAAPELVAAVERAVAGRPVAEPAPSKVEPFREGVVERRLGALGSTALVRLSVPLPAAGDPSRTSVETLWELLPSLLRAEAPQLVARVDGDQGTLESRHEPEVWELELGRLRLGLARVASAPALEPQIVADAAARLAVRRLAVLEGHPEGSRRVVELHLSGGASAVREFLFGASGVTLETVRRAALAWLPQHPGLAEVILPPRALNPRFAPGPEVVRLGNDLSVAVLERPSTPLAALVVRPVVVPDVDGQLSATMLARVAMELRRQTNPPGWIRITEAPPSLELAAGADDLEGLAEALRLALEHITTDAREVAGDDSDARRRALSLAAGRLGLSELVAPTPADLLRPSNLALGVVAPDGEAALETLSKLLVAGDMAGEPAATTIVDRSRTREAVAGSRSTVVVVVPLAGSLAEGASRVFESVLLQRAAGALAGVDVEVLRPYVPGRPTLLVVATTDGRLDDLERRLATAWSRVTRPLAEAELEEARRSVAVDGAAATSGAVGRARRAAAVAVGSVSWRAPSDLELEILTTSVDAVSAQLQAVRSFEQLETCGAGVLPIPPPAAGARSD